MDNSLKTRSLEFYLTVGLILFLALLAFRGFWVPLDAARGFGIPLAHSADAFYLHVKADRDLSTAVALTLLLVLRQRRALAAFVAAALVQPICDAALVISDPRGDLAYALAVHGSAVLYGMLLLAVLVRRLRLSSGGLRAEVVGTSMSGPDAPDVVRLSR
jgi:hypothetical protein